MSANAPAPNTPPPAAGPTPEQRFRRAVWLAVACGAVLLAYIGTADRFIPLTPEARVLSGVTRIAPEVSGRVVSVGLANNAEVRPGQLLFEIDPTAYQQAVTAAELAVQQAEQDNRELDANVVQARATVASAQVAAADAARQAARLGQLLEGRYVSVTDSDTATTRKEASAADLQAAAARLHAAEVQRGLADTRNLKLRTALNRLDVARRDLGHTRVLAVGAGRVANLQLRPGDFVQTGSPVMALVGTAPMVAADFREKTLARVRLGDRAFVTFDAKPGEVYPGRVDSIDAGIAQGQLNADGALVQTVETDRWIRRAERVRVNILLDEPLSLTSGARATVQISPGQGGVWARIATWQIRLVAFFRYVY